jgi:endonuclease G
VREGNELYIYSGGYGIQKMIDSGRVTVPLRTWKIIVVLPAGENDLERINDSTRVIAVDMPNSNNEIGKNDDWKNFRVCVDDIERKTGFDFLSNVPQRIQSRIEKIIDSK